MPAQRPNAFRRPMGQAPEGQQPAPQDRPVMASDLASLFLAMRGELNKQQGRVQPGALVQYYNDLSSGVIAPEDMRIEDLQFRVQIDPSGQIISQSDPILLISRYNFALRRIMGIVMDPAFAGAAPSLVSFQIREAGRNFDVFKRPVSMQSLMLGTFGVAEWDGVYITVPGTTLEVNWTVDNTRWPALVGAAKEFGVQLLGDYVACSPVE